MCVCVRERERVRESAYHPSVDQAGHEHPERLPRAACAPSTQARTSLAAPAGPRGARRPPRSPVAARGGRLRAPGLPGLPAGRQVQRERPGPAATRIPVAAGRARPPHRPMPRRIHNRQVRDPLVSACDSESSGASLLRDENGACGVHACAHCAVNPRRCFRRGQAGTERECLPPHVCAREIERVNLVIPQSVFFALALGTEDPPSSGTALPTFTRRDGERPVADDCVMCPPGKYQPQPASVGPAAAAGETVLVAAAAAGAALLCLACPGEGLHVPSTSVVAALSLSLSSFFSFSSLSLPLCQMTNRRRGGACTFRGRGPRERERESTARSPDSDG